LGKNVGASGKQNNSTTICAAQFNQPKKKKLGV